MMTPKSFVDILRVELRPLRLVLGLSNSTEGPTANVSEVRVHPVVLDAVFTFT